MRSFCSSTYQRYASSQNKHLALTRQAFTTEKRYGKSSMKNDLIQGIIFPGLSRTPQSRTKPTRQYLKQTLGLHGSIFDASAKSYRLFAKMDKRYSEVSSDYAELIASDLVERLHIRSDEN